MKARYVLPIVCLLSSISSAKATSAVQWGAPGGDTSIVETTIKLQRPFNTTYLPNTKTIAQPRNDYYPNSEGRSTTLNITCSSPNANVSIADKPDGDPISIGKNSNETDAMIVWEHLPSGRLSTLSINIEGTGSGYTDGSYRFILESADGKWAASEAYTVTKAGDERLDVPVAELDWYVFKPISNGVYSTGKSTTIDLNSIRAVGYLQTLAPNDATTYKGTQVRYFKATFTEIEKKNVKMNRPTNASNSENGNVIADFAGDFKANENGPDWRYQWNPTGIEIGDRANYKALEKSEGKYRLTADRDRVLGTDGPENANWLLVRKGVVTPGEAKNKSSDNLAHFAIVSYTIQEGEAGNISIQNSIIEGRNESSSCEMRIYINDELLGSDITGGAASKFDIELGHMNVGDTFYLALGGHDGKSIGTNVQFQLVSE